MSGNTEGVSKFVGFVFRNTKKNKDIVHILIYNVKINHKNTVKIK
jgi:hypothetical protein